MTPAQYQSLMDTIMCGFIGTMILVTVSSLVILSVMIRKLPRKGESGD